MSERLANGIVLPDEWPPRDYSPDTSQPMKVPYLERPPAVIPFDGGRRLLVDDYLIEDSTMPRAFHHPVKHTGNPVLHPQTADERNDALPPTAIPKCGGVWYVGRDRLFKMWYMASYLGAMAYAVSRDGLHWERPLLDVVSGAIMLTYSDGIHWIPRTTTGPMGDRSTMFYDPYRRVWVQSIRSSSPLRIGAPANRCTGLPPTVWI